MIEKVTSDLHRRPTKQEEKTTESLLKSLKEHQKELRDIMSKVAIISSAIAVGTLVLLGTDKPVQIEMILIGIVILLFEVVVVIFWLLYQNISRIDHIKNVFSKILEPLRDLRPEDKNTENFREERKRIILNAKLILKQNKATRNRSHLVELTALIFLGFGVAMIILGLLHPHVCSDLELNILLYCKT